MLWSQITLTTYDFNDLHIIGEFDNHPGIGRFLRNFSFVVTADFTRMKHIFTCNDVYNNIKIRHPSSKETGCKN